jgi:hypothetical protein
MAEQTKKTKPNVPPIPEDVRSHARSARQELRQGIEAMLPPEVREHHRKARKEMLLAWRSMLDHAIQRMDEKKE